MGDHSTFSSFVTRSHKSLLPCKASKMLYSAQGNTHPAFEPTAYFTLHVLLQKHTTPQRWQWGRNLPGLSLLLQWIQAASSPHQVLCINSTQIAEQVPIDGLFSDSAWLKQAKKACVLLWFCISLSHSSQRADVRRLFTFGSTAVSRLGRKYCTTAQIQSAISSYPLTYWLI